MKELIDEWNHVYIDTFHAIYCVGSRWSNVHIGFKTKNEYIPPSLPKNYEQLQHACLGWINEEKIKMYAFSPHIHTRVIVCGLPGVYDKLCGPRFVNALEKGSVLDNLGYSEDMVIKL